ncbi:MAG: hypothetical protein WA771_14985 [Chthoniobacterales bacterium]
MGRSTSDRRVSRSFRRLLVWTLVLIILSPFLAIAAYYGFENVSGQMAWRVAQQKLEQLGEPLAVADIRPAPLPDDRNMAAAPIFRQLFATDPTVVAAADLSLLRLPAELPGDHASDIVGLARGFQADFSGTARDAAAIVSDGLAPMAEIITRLRAAADRPESSWPISLDGSFNFSMPFLKPLARAAEVIAARGMAALADDSPSEALADFHLITDLAAHSNEPSLLVSSLLEQSMLLEAIRVVEEGTTAQTWSGPDLAAIQDRLSRVHPLRRFADSVRGERVLFLQASDQLDFKASAFFAIVDISNATVEKRTRALSYFIWGLRPSGWRARDRARYLTLSQEYLDTVIANEIVDVAAVAEWNARIRSIRRDDFEMFRTPLTVLTLPAFGAAARRAAFAQSRVDQARLACALERFRLRHADLPQRLGELLPEFIDRLPRDVIGGRHFAYRRTSPDSFTLHSLGWNGRDDSKLPASVNEPRDALNRPDWTWASR